MRRRQLAVAAAAALLGGGAFLGGSMARGAGSAATCNLVPQLRDVTINQGLGSYSPIEYGKETLGRLYLSLPSCAGTSASIQVTNATLTMTGAGVSPQTFSMTPTPSATAYPAIATFSTAPMPDSTGDPKFVIPGAALTNSTGAAFTATFTATVSYQAKTSKTGTPVTGTANFAKLPTSLTDPTPSANPITASVDKKTNPFHVLVVPMGDATKVYSSQFSATAQAAVQDGMTATMSRVLPVAAGVGSLGSTGGEGLQYTIDPTLLDLRSLGLITDTTKFCGDGTSYNTIKGQLYQLLRSWQTANPGVQVDSVLGVIDPLIALGPPNPCFEGMGQIGSAEAWAQAITGRGGQLLGVEGSHTLGLTPKDRESPFDAGHSQNFTAENPSLNRRYNVVQRAYITTDRSLMKPSATSPSPDNTNVLLEAPDFAYLRCIFGGAANTECTTYPKTLGSITSATLVFVMSGTTDGSGDLTCASPPCTGEAPGTKVVESYFSSSTTLTPPDSTSSYYLRQKTPSGNIDSGVPVNFVASEHAGSSQSTTQSVGLFSIAQVFDPSTTRIEFWKGTPGAIGSHLLYAQNKSDPPVITGMTAGSSPIQLQLRRLSARDDRRLAAAPRPPATRQKAAHATRSAVRGSALRGMKFGAIRGLRVRQRPPAGRFDPWRLLFGAALDATFTVNSTGDGADSNTGDGVCDDGSGKCTLRAAIQQANAISGADTINFDIPTPRTITPASALPQITDPVTIDATTQGGAGYTGPPLVELNGASTTGYGLSTSAAVTIRGLVINRFPGSGIALFPGSGQSHVEGNYIGTDATGNENLGNAGSGVQVFSSGNTIGGSGDAARNIISGNDTGIALLADGNTVTGDYIGTNAGGTAALGNASDGIALQGSSSNTITNNVISGTKPTNAAGAGIDLYQSAAQSTNNTIQGNLIGTDKDGAVALGNSRRGINLNGASSNTIGGTGSGQANVISGNTGDGIDIPQGQQNVIQGNLIGVAADGTSALGNGGFGIQMSASINTIGGATSGAGNVIANNGSAGIVMTAGTGDGILGNRFYSNGLLGIDLGGDGVTQNDPGDTDTGPNNRQNFPLISSATLASGTLSVTGTLDTNANLTNPAFRIEIFQNSACDASGNGEGETFVGSFNINVDSSGHASFTQSLATTATGTQITATATADGTGDTSEFSACVAASAGGGGGGGGDSAQTGPTFTVNTANDHSDATGCTVNDCSLREAINAANSHANGAGPDHISFAIAGSGPQQIAVQGSQLPSITDPVVIDGDTEASTATGIPAGSKAIVLNGDGAGSSADGLVLAAASGGSEIKGFAIRDFQCSVPAPDPCSSGYGLDIQSNGNTIDGNYVGLRADGLVAATNKGGGVLVESNGNTIGGTTNATRNVIAGNALAGTVRSQLVVTGNNNVVSDNYIGVAADGTTELNAVTAITLQGGGTGNTIGGDKSLGNYILGRVGVEVQSAGNTIAGNYIGLDAAGVVHAEVLPGIDVATTNGTIIGDGAVPPAFANPDRGNVIVGHTGDAAIFVYQGNGTRMAGNFLGTNRSGATNMGNGEGVRFSGGGNNTVGPGNVIAWNSGYGVHVGSPTNRIVANSIHDNGSLGIWDDPNFVTITPPTLTSASKSGTTTTVNGTFSGTANKQFFIEFFNNSQCDPSGAGEGETYIGFANPTTNDAGNASYSFSSTSPAVGDVITATATNATELSTSQFSACKTVVSSNAPPGQEPVNVTASDDHPSETRLDLFLDCGSGKPKFPVAVGLKPDSVTATSASFSYNYDPSLACPNGTLKAVANDGFTSTGFTPTGSAPADSGPNDVRVAISSPLNSQQFLTYSLIPLRGSARNAAGELPDSGLQWTVSGPGITRSGGGHQVDLNPPASGGWPSGSYTATLTATAAGKTASTSVTFSVQTDADNDGIPASVESQSCFTSGDNDPTNAFLDYDGDGIPNATDPQPCQAATSYTAIADFNPDPLPLTSNGNPVTFYVRVPYRNVAQIVPSSVRITRIGDDDVSTDSRFLNIGWTVSGGVGTAKFDRQKLIQYLIGRNIHNRTITITIAGKSGAPPWSFEGSDTTFVQG